MWDLKPSVVPKLALSVVLESAIVIDVACEVDTLLMML